MPEETPATTTPAEETAPTTTETVAAATPSDADMKAELEKWKALARKNESRAKANAEAAQRLSEIEESQKSETQKLAEAKEAAEKEAAEAKAMLARTKAAVDHGLSAEDMELLQFVPADKVDEYAQKLAARRTQSIPSPMGNVGDPIPSGPDQIESTEQLKKMSSAEITKALSEGRLNKLMGATS